MTESFPTYTVTTAETGLTEGDSEYAGSTKYIWRQPDLKDDGGYWEAIELTDQPARSAENFDLILERLAAIEKVLKIDENRH